MAELTRPALITLVDIGIEWPMVTEASPEPSTQAKSQDGAKDPLPGLDSLTLQVTRKPRCPVTTPSADIGPPTPRETVLSTTNITQHYTDGADMLAHGPHGLTSAVMARKISPVTINMADIGQDSPEDTHGAHPSITVPTGARVESLDTPTSGMIPLIQRPKI